MADGYYYLLPSAFLLLGASLGLGVAAVGKPGFLHSGSQRIVHLVEQDNADYDIDSAAEYEKDSPDQRGVQQRQA